MPNTAKPLALIDFTGKSHHITKKIREERAETEITMGDHKFFASMAIKKNPDAHLKWLELTEFFVDHDIKFVTTSDNDIIEMFCFAYSEYIELLEHRRAIKAIVPPAEEKISEISTELEQYFGSSEIKGVMSKINFLLTVQGDLVLDKAINAKIELMLKLSDRLFLNPLSKIRSIPSRKAKEADPNKELFGD